MPLMTVKIKNDSNKIKYIPIIKKYSNSSIGEIKKEIENDKPVMSCDYIKDAEKLESFYNISNELKDSGAEIKVFQKDELISLDLVKNQIESHQETMRQIDMEDSQFDS